MKPVRTWLVAALIAASTPAIIGTNSMAQAAELNKEQARALFQEALALVAAADYATALEKLQRVASYKRTPQVEFYIAVCHENMGKLVMALGEYRIAMADASTAAVTDVVSEAAAAIEKLEPRIPMLTITKARDAQTSAIEVDGKGLGDSAIGVPMPVDPGTRVIVGKAAGFEPFHKEVQLREGEKVTVEVALGKRVAVVATTPPGKEPPKQGASFHSDDVADSGGSNALAWISTGIGAVGLGASAYFFAQRSKAISDLDDACKPNKNACPSSVQSTYDDGKRNTLLGNVSLGVGVAGVLTGIVLFASSSGGGDNVAQPEQGLRLVPSSPGSWAGMSVNGRF